MSDISNWKWRLVSLLTDSHAWHVGKVCAGVVIEKSTAKDVVKMANSVGLFSQGYV